MNIKQAITKTATRLFVSQDYEETMTLPIAREFGEAHSERELEHAIIARIEVGEKIWQQSQRIQQLIDGGVEISFVTGEFCHGLI